MDFKDKVIVITGGTSGIGKATAIAFSKKNAHVIALTVDNQDIAKEAIEEINEAGGTGEYITCDVTDESKIKESIAYIVEKYGRIDYAFNNAGIGPDGVRMPYLPLTELDEKTWDLVVDVDMKGVFLCMKHELLQMQKQGYGSIVNTASIGGYRMAPDFGAYGPAKAGVIALSELAALENAKYGIRVNCICPGPTADTQLTKNTLSINPDQEEIFKEHVIPLKKLATAKEVANAVIYLCSDLSSHTTGQKLFIDGGMSVK